MKYTYKRLRNYLTLIIVVLFTTLNISAAEPIPSTPANWTDGSGGTISTFEELLWLSLTPTAWDENWVQTADIDASASTELNSGEGFSPIGNATNKFTGTYNGLGHTISNLYINRPSDNYVGLFGYVENAKISNIGIKSGSIVGRLYIGSIVGYSKLSIVANCYSYCVLNSTEGYIGGIIGYNKSGNVTNCYFSGSFNNTNNFAGGIVGYQNYITDVNPTTSYCYVNGEINGGDPKYTNAIIGALNSGNIRYNYFDSVLTNQSMAFSNNNINIMGVSNAAFNTETFIDSISARGVWSFDIANDTAPWVLVDGDSVPRFYWEQPDNNYKYSEITIYTKKAGNLLPNAKVTLGDSTKYTDSNGMVTFYNHAEYGQLFIATTDGYRSIIDTVNTFDTDTIEVNFTEVQSVDFTFTNTNLSINFTNTSTNNLHQFTWDFGNGLTSSEKSPEHSYENAGYYNVCLSGLDTVTNDVATICNEVLANDNSTTICKTGLKYSTNELSVEFSDTSTNDFTEYTWDFGDGKTSNEISPIYNYAESGYYTVKLSAFNSSTNCFAEEVKTIYVESSTNNSNFVSANFNFVVRGDTVTFNNNSLGKYTDIFWDFGNNTTSTEEQPIVEFNQSGQYNVCLSVYDSESGNISEKCKRVIITETPEDICNAYFQYHISNDTVTVINKSTGTANDFFWSFGNGEYSSSDTTAKAIYTKTGSFDISLTMYNSSTGCIDTYEDEISITDDNLNYCFADFNYIAKGYDVTVTDNSRGNITHHFWDFGDGTYETDESASHTYKEPGYYTIYHSVYNFDNECMDETEKVVLITDYNSKQCNADFTYATATDGTILFKSLSTGDFDSFFWDYDNGTHSNSNQPAYRYKKSGYYNVLLTLKYTPDTSLCYIYKNVYVAPSGKSTEPLVSAFTSNATIDNLAVNFNDRSIGNIDSWYWDFGDNSTPSTNTSPNHTYAEGGYYNVCLTTRNDDFQNTTCKTIVVGDITGKHSSYFIYFADTAANTVFIDNKSMGNIAKYTWDFGDGVISNEKKPSHTYTQEGYYAICLTTESMSGDIRTYCQDINVTSSLIDSCTYNCVWPGDANNDNKANHYDILTIGMNFGMEGPLRINASIDSVGQVSVPWARYQLDSTNNMHGDCNGDGIINLDDTLAIRSNFAHEHIVSPEEFRKSSEWGLKLEFESDASSLKGTAKTRAIRTVLVGPMDKSTHSIYGLGYELELQGAQGLNWDKISVNFNGTFLSNTTDDLITFYYIDSTKRTIYISLSRKDGQDVTNDGGIAIAYLPFPNGGGESISAKVTSSGGIQANSSDVYIKGGIFTGINNKKANANNFDLNVYPNPNSGTFTVSSTNVGDNEIVIEIFDVIGEKVYSNNYKTKIGFFKEKIELGKLQHGVYLLKAESDGKTFIDRIVVQ